MHKLINLQVKKAEGVICAWCQPDDCEDIIFGIARDDAELNFEVPLYIAIGVFDDGSVRCGGLQSLNSLNDQDTPLFLYDQFLECVSEVYAKAFVRGRISFGEYDNEAEAKGGIYQELMDSGVMITDDAKAYLLNLPR